MVKQKAAKTKATPVKKGSPLAEGVGRRKKSVARVWLRKGTGSIKINNRDYQTYFDTETARLEAAKPFQVIPAAMNFDVEAIIQGGGLKGQSGALKVGIARALLAVDEDLRPTLREHGLLTIDSRQKERKKYGQKAARRKFQFVKR
ncbi:MAG: 30S ribosomal protein S9 [Candidatus Babeliales bacterium]